jgi:uncharacterized protein YbbC (DUF1343 family)
MQEIARLFPGRGAFEAGDPKRFRMFDQVTGSDHIRTEFARRQLFEDIRDYWRKDEAAFKQLSTKYYLYE